MLTPEPGSATPYADNSRPRPEQRSITGPDESRETAPFESDHHFSQMSGYANTNSSRQASKGGIPVPNADQDDRRDSRHDSHDLSISNGGRVRDSLLDNLLLSFDKIGDGTFGGFDSSPFFSNIDEVSDDESIYERGRTDSIDYHSQFENPTTRQLDSSHGDGSFGVTYDGSSNRDTRSRGGRGLNSSHGYVNGYEPAPAPSIRTRNRTPSPPRSPRLVRRNSNKSIKSLRSRDQQFSHHAPEASLPPLPAFASPPSAPASMAPAKPTGKPGFFRRVFGGGISALTNSNPTPPTPTTTTNNSKPNPDPSTAKPSTNNSSNSAAPVPPPAPAPAPVPATPTQTAAPASLADPSRTDAPPLYPTLTKKSSSFFRRRKKSLSDTGAPPVPVAPVPEPINVAATAGLPPPARPVDPAQPSPATSLRAAMNPYIRSSTRPATLESPMEGRETSYTAKNATIRTVASSDDMTPRRPSFFGDSPRSPTRAGKSDDGTGTGKQYQKEPWAPAWETGGDTEEQGPPRSPTDTSKFRPQTSPDSPLGSRTFFFDDDEGETHWPPSAPFRNILPISGSTSPDNRYLRQDSMDPVGKTRKSSTASNNIVDMRSIEKQYDDEARKMSDAGSLGLTNGGLAPNRAGESWIRSSTPTVTLQKDGHGEEAEVLPNEPEVERKQSNAFDDGIAEPNEDECEMARKIYEGDEEFVLKDQATAWLGDPLPERAVILKAYMRMFCWSGINILQAMRMLCERLVLRGETQQVDRIMVAFSHRWCEDNPNHGFKTSDIVHTILYSVLLLNTDIHVADIPSSQKMSRSQFVKNTMSTIRRVIQEATENEEIEFGKGSNKNLTAGNTRARRNTEDESSFLQSNTFPGMGDTMKGHKSRPSLEFQKEHKGSRLSRINLGNLSPRIMPDDQNDKDFDLDGGNALVSTAMGGSLRLWEAQVEIVLKDFYNSIKTTALPLHGSPQEKIEPVNNNPLAAFGNAAASVAGGMLNTATGGMLRRTPSNISKAASEISVRTGRRENKQNLGATWSSKNRSRQRVYNGSFAGSSRTSLEDRSVWSPSASSTWSKYTLDKTQTSMSVDSLHSTMTHAQDYQASVGFANALSNAIIREEGASITSGEAENGDLLDGDDTLELEGAPWAKEGLLKHKHHLESVDKRAKNRGWTECFAVIQRGYMRLFQFPSKGAKSPQFSGGVVGGGNWTENAEPIGSFLLRQSIASALPPPGYSKSRPNVWALSLPSGAVHFFEVGTMDIVKEFVTTANYWSARLSKEPLIGGVSNVEYGWGDCLIDLETTNSPPPSVNSGDANSRQSLQISIRSSMDQAIRPRLPGDKLNLKDWTPPTQSMVASNMNEKDQLKALENYVANIEAELSKHNDLRPLMQLAFTPRHPNAGKAHANWEKKSSYLLREIIKFRTYIETLQAAINRRAMVDEKRASWAVQRKDSIAVPTTNIPIPVEDDDDVIPVGLSSMISTGGPPPKKETEKSDGDKKDGKDDEEDDEEEFKMSARLDGPARLELDFISSAFT